VPMPTERMHVRRMLALSGCCYGLMSTPDPGPAWDPAGADGLMSTLGPVTAESWSAESWSAESWSADR
jgi:hypothetical protein